MTSSPSPAATDQRQLVFRVGDQRHEIDASRVVEVVRVPHITRVPYGPQALAGIANLRGKPIPVLSMTKMLNALAATAPNDGKIIVYDHGGAVGLLVDDVVRLSKDVDAPPLHGLGDLLDAAFKMEKRRSIERVSLSRDDTEKHAASVVRRSVLSFRVAGQLYGLPLDHIREVGAFDNDILEIPNAAYGVIGLMPIRGGVLPLISLASLLGLETGQPVNAGSRTIVIEHENALVGLVVDKVDAIWRIPENDIDAVPAVLQRGRGDAQIDAIGRIADGKLLLSILSAEKLFNHEAVSQAIGRNPGAHSMEAELDQDDTLEQFLIFQLGDEAYGLPIASVDEVIRVPAMVTRMPGAPSFVMGVVNLRGKAIPLIDQRTRFDMDIGSRTGKMRAVILTLGSLQAGFVVDGVSEVKAIAKAALSAAPEFSTDRTEVFDRVAHMEADGRMILLVDPQEMLSRAERDIVAAITDDDTVVDAP